MIINMDTVTDTLIDLALREDIGAGDVTSAYFVPEGKQSESYIYAKADGVLAGVEVAAEVFRRVDPSLVVKFLKQDGDAIFYGDHVIEISGSVRSILTAERAALNFLQRLSGIASQTAVYISRVAGTKACVLDTRKTTPGWRAIEKAAVVAGGGTNHRMGLYDRAMVKDNHLVAQNELEALQQGILQLREDHPDVKVELEADTLEQVANFYQLSGVDYILLDNMSNEQTEKAVSMRLEACGDTGPLLEASGGVNLDTIAGIAKTGVDFISVGALTHSAVALDLSLEIR
jgi:nicotinate-nucleotide pyrophosphorylase (carboxylating)